MQSATQLPLWAVFAVGLGTPLLAFLGALLGHVVARRGAKELEARSRREETLRNLRWAAELAVSPEERRARLGLVQLEALIYSELVGPFEQTLLAAALDAVYEDPVDAVEDGAHPELETGGLTQDEVGGGDL